MKPKGAGMEMSDSRQFAWGIAATDVEYSWDGRVFISDFITGWAAHDDGRLLSLSATAVRFAGKSDLYAAFEKVKLSPFGAVSDPGLRRRRH
jgi:hypothetical protein